MRKIFGVDLRDAIPFIVCTLLYVALVFGWNLSGIADSDIPFIRGVVPVIGDLPPQSISRFFVTATLYLMALLYALWSLAASEYRRYLVQFLGLSVVTFLAWVALNYWVIAGFLNSPNTVLNGAVAIVLLIGWMGGVMSFLSEPPQRSRPRSGILALLDRVRGFTSGLHDPLALFLVRFGIGLATFVTIVQVLAVATPDWRSPTQGIPLLYTLTLNALVGIFLAGAGGNMLWRERRQEALAAGRRKR
jgi:hypothetical protein